MPDVVVDPVVRDRLDRLLGAWLPEELNEARTTVRCGGQRHRVLVSRHGITALDHSFADSVAAALTGAEPPCLTAVREPAGRLRLRRDLAEWLAERDLSVVVCDAAGAGVRPRRVRRFLDAGWPVSEAVAWRSWRLGEATRWRDAGVPEELALALRDRGEWPCDGSALLAAGWRVSTAVLWARHVPVGVAPSVWHRWRDLPAGTSMCLEYAARRLDPTQVADLLRAGSTPVEALKLAHSRVPVEHAVSERSRGADVDAVVAASGSASWRVAS